MSYIFKSLELINSIILYIIAGIFIIVGFPLFLGEYISNKLNYS